MENMKLWQATEFYADGEVSRRETVALPAGFTVGYVRAWFYDSRNWCRGAAGFNPSVEVVEVSEADRMPNVQRSSAGGLALGNLSGREYANLCVDIDARFYSGDAEKAAS